MTFFWRKRYQEKEKEHEVKLQRVLADAKMTAAFKQFAAKG